MFDLSSEDVSPKKKALDEVVDTLWNAMDHGSTVTIMTISDFGNAIVTCNGNRYKLSLTEEE